MTLLDIENLHVQFDNPDGTVEAVNGLSLSVDRGEILGIVGESGSGKSVTARSIMGLQSPGRITEGTISYDGTDLANLPDTKHRQYRGSELAMVFQDPRATLNPVFDVGEQIAESLRIHEQEDNQSLLDFLHLPPFTDRSAWVDHRSRAIDLMDKVGISNPEDRVHAYPDELSGGMCQRVMIAIALSADPNLLVVDEPTAALDTTTQARILDRLRKLATETNTAIIVISHDIGVVDELCDRIAVMYGGQVMEMGPTNRVVESPKHPYTKGLVDCRITADSSYPLQTISGSSSGHTSDTGCPFASRCEYATTDCRESKPPTVSDDLEHLISCGELDSIQAISSHDRITADEGSNKLSDTTPSPKPCYDGGQHQQETTNPSNSNSTASLIETRGLTKQFNLSNSIFDHWLDKNQMTTAIENVNLSVSRSETLGIVGESGSGKSTLANILTGLCPPTAGEVVLDGEPVGIVEDRSTEQLQDVGVVFQNPQDSINPRLTIREAIAEPLVEAGWSQSDRIERTKKLLDLVGLSPQYGSSRPHQLSGGQIQRVAIARAIALEPKIVILDEPVSGLDLSTQATLLNLLINLQNRLDITYLVISHDLDVIRFIADRIVVMYEGAVVERGQADLVFDHPTHFHTKALVEAATGKK